MNDHYFQRNDEPFVWVNFGTQADPDWRVALNAKTGEWKPQKEKIVKLLRFGGAKLTRGGRKSLPIAITYKKRVADDPILDLLWDSFRRERPVGLACTDSDIESPTAGGFEAWCLVHEFSLIAGNGEAGSIYEITAEPTDYFENGQLITPTQRQDLTDMDLLTNVPVSSGVFHSAKLHQSIGVRSPAQDLDDQRSGLGTKRNPIGGKATQFDGVGQFCFAPEISTGDYDTNESFTFSVWYKTNSATTGNGNGIVYKRSTSQSVSPGYSFIANGSTTLFRLSDGANTIAIDAGLTNDNQWHHAICERDAVANTISMYLDGVLVDTRSTAGLTGSTLGHEAVHLALGALALYDGNSNYHEYSGLLWQFRLTAQVLTAEQKTKLYTNPTEDQNDIPWTVFSPLEVHSLASEENIGSTDDLATYGYDATSEYSGADVPGSRLDTVGYSVIGGKVVSAATDGQTDYKNGNPLQYKGIAPNHAKLVSAHCLALNGVDQYGQLPNPISLTGDFTVGALVDFRSVSGSPSMPLPILASNDTANVFGTTFQHPTDDQCRLKIGDAWVSFNVAEVPNLNELAWVVLRRTGNLLELLLGDQLSGSTTNPTGTFTVQRFGRYGSTHSEQVLTCAFIAGLAVPDNDLAAIRKFELPQSVDHFWSFSQGSGPTVHDVVGSEHLVVSGYDSGVWSQTQNEYHRNFLQGFNLVDGVKIPAASPTHDVLGNPLSNPAVPGGHNNCESAIDFTGGVPVVGSAGWPTAWRPGDPLSNPAFCRLITKAGVTVGADRFLRYRTALTGQKLADVQKYTRTKEL